MDYISFSSITFSSQAYTTLTAVTAATGVDLYVTGSIVFRLDGTTTSPYGHALKDPIIRLGSAAQLSKFVYKGEGVINAHFYTSNTNSLMDIKLSTPLVSQSVTVDDYSQYMRAMVFGLSLMTDTDLLVDVEED